MKFPSIKIEKPRHIQTEQPSTETSQRITSQVMSTVNPSPSSPPVRRWPKDPESQPKPPTSRGGNIGFEQLTVPLSLKRKLYEKTKNGNLQMDILHT